MHCLYLIFISGAVASSIYRAFTTGPQDYRDVLFYILTHPCWPPLVWLMAATACTVPLAYAISPPSMPDREDLLYRDEVTGIAHPTEEAKRAKWGKTNLLHEGFYMTVTFYTTVIFFGSWFY